MPGSKERTSAASMAGRIVQSVGGRNPRRMRVPLRMAVSEVEIKAGSGGGNEALGGASKVRRGRPSPGVARMCSGGGSGTVSRKVVRIASS